MSRQALAITHRESIIERVARGDRLADIASDIGLAGKGQAISNALAQDPEYQAAREWGLASRLDQREEEMETCSPQDVPRARELLSHARWRAERECPKRWGPRQEITHVQGISITEALEQARQRVIDGEFRECYEREGGTPSGFGEVT